MKIEVTPEMRSAWAIEEEHYPFFGHPGATKVSAKAKANLAFNSPPDVVAAPVAEPQGSAAPAKKKSGESDLEGAIRAAREALGKSFKTAKGAGSGAKSHATTNVAITILPIRPRTKKRADHKPTKLQPA